MNGTVRIKRGHEAPLLRHHPWVFSGAIEAVEGAREAGETVEVLSADGEWLARGAWSPQSQISVRLWTFRADEPVDEAFFRNRLTAANAWRESLGWVGGRRACRIVNAESDGLPGLVVDRYADTWVCQFGSAGVEHWKDTIVRVLAEREPGARVYERSDTGGREWEGLPVATGQRAGPTLEGPVEIDEGGCRFRIDVAGGHKTGFYLDQRCNRERVAACARDAEILNCFAYTGAFGVRALHGGAARVVNVDTSRPALELARQHAADNGIEAARMECIEDDVGRFLRGCRDRGLTFDIIILDPPKFAETKGQVQKACRAYKDINLLGMKLLRPGGRLFTFSCSGHIPADLFQKVVASAGMDARRDVQIIDWLGQPPDHPVGLAFPEGLYLKGLVCRVT